MRSTADRSRIPRPGTPRADRRRLATSIRLVDGRRRTDAAPRAWARAAVAATCAATAACALPPGGDDPAVVPPLAGQAAIEAWLDAGHYRAWACEPAAHPAPATSPHGAARVCANAIALADPARVDAALVIEQLDGGGAVVGRGAQRHTRAGDDGATWYWYLRVPPDDALAHDADGLAADGWGFEGPAQTSCGACHARAGHDLDGASFVFTRPAGGAR